VSRELGVGKTGSPKEKSEESVAGSLYFEEVNSRRREYKYKSGERKSGSPKCLSFGVSDI